MSTKPKTASRVSGVTVVRKGTEYEFNFTDSQNPTHEVVGGENPDADTKLLVLMIQDSIQSRCTQPGIDFPAALALSVEAPNIIISSDFDATIMVWPPR